MKISDIFGPNIDIIANQKKVRGSTQTQNTQTTNAKNTAMQDSVHISQAAKVLSNLSSLEANHQKRLEEVQKAYENGAYKPDLTNLAKSILEEIKNG